MSISNSELEIWKKKLFLLIADFEDEVYSLAMERYEGDEYHPNISTSGREDVEKALHKHINSLNVPHA